MQGSLPHPEQPAGRGWREILPSRETKVLLACGSDQGEDHSIPPSHSARAQENEGRCCGATPQCNPRDFLAQTAQMLLHCPTLKQGAQGHPRIDVPNIRQVHTTARRHGIFQFRRPSAASCRFWVGAAASSHRN